MNNEQPESSIDWAQRVGYRNLDERERALLRDYWDAQAQFGSFEVGPDEALSRYREVTRGEKE